MNYGGYCAIVRNISHSNTYYNVCLRLNTSNIGRSMNCGSIAEIGSVLHWALPSGVDCS